METIRGKKSLDIGFYGLKDRLANYNRILLDLGTGDGRYVRTLAEKHPDWFIIGVDACRENLHKNSQTKLQNILFVIASGQDLPPELNGLVSHLTINFPWGSLLGSLLAGDPALIGGLASLTRGSTFIDLRLNGGALMEAGTTLESGAERICSHLRLAGWQITAPTPMDRQALSNFPSTWAKRLAFGRDPRAVSISGCLK